MNLIQLGLYVLLCGRQAHQNIGGNLYKLLADIQKIKYLYLWTDIGQSLSNNNSM